MAAQNTSFLTRQQMIWGGAALGVLILLVAGWFVFSPSDGDASTPKVEVTLVPTDRTIGDPKAPIVMVEYASLTCSHCARFATTVFPKLKAKYIDSGKVYYVYRDFPLDAIALQAAALARCLPQQSYYDFVDLLFHNQEKWAFVPDTHGGLITMARTAGLSEAKADACMANQAELTRINQVAQDGQVKYAISGTPTFVVDGTLKSGEFSWESVQEFLDQRLGKQKKSFWDFLGL